MVSSPLMLSFTTIFSLLGTVLMVVALSFDNWVEYQVNRRDILNAFEQTPQLAPKLKEGFTKNIIYYSRNYGLFNICFGDTLPTGIGSYNKLGSTCITYNDYFPSESELGTYNQNQYYRLYLLRGMVVCFGLGILLLLISFIVGISACWNRSQRYVTMTAVMILIALLLVVLGMLGWQASYYLEHYILDVAPFYRSWEPVLKSTTKVSFGWSWVVAWAGIGFLVLATIFMFLSSRALRKEEDKAYEAKHNYPYPNYYDMKSAMVPSYSYNTYGYGQYPGYYGQYNNQYYGYMTYGR